MDAAAETGFDTLDVLARSGRERDSFCIAIGGEPDDPGVVRAACSVPSRPGKERLPVAALLELAAICRALDACATAQIGLAELRTGLALLAASTDGFGGLGSSRPLARTLNETVADESLSQRSVLRQVRLVHGHLFADLAEQLTGDPGALRVPRRPGSSDAWREQLRVDDATVAGELDALASEWLDESVGGARRAIWVRGWVAVPVLGDAWGEDAAEVARLASALRSAGSEALLQVKLVRPSRYSVRGTTIAVNSRTRASYSFAPTLEELALAVSGDRGACLFTTTDAAFVVLEQLDHRIVAGPKQHVEELCGMTAPEALARFREAVEELGDDVDDPPEHLLDACRRYGHGRRRSA